MATLHYRGGGFRHFRTPVSRSDHNEQQCPCLVLMEADPEISLKSVKFLYWNVLEFRDLRIYINVLGPSHYMIMRHIVTDPWADQLLY